MSKESSGSQAQQPSASRKLSVRGLNGGPVQTPDEEAVERLQMALKKEVERVLRYNFHDVCVANNEEMTEDLTSVVHLARGAWDEYCQESGKIVPGTLDEEQMGLIHRFEQKQEKLSELTNELIESKRTLKASRDAYKHELEYLKELNWQMGIGRSKAPVTAENVDDSSAFTAADQEAYNRAVISAMESGLKAKHKTELAALRLANVAEQKGLQQRIEATKLSRNQAMQEHAARVTKLVKKLEMLGVPLSSADRGELATAYRYLETEETAQKRSEERIAGKAKAIAPGEVERGDKASRMSLVTKRMSAFENAPRSSVLATLAGIDPPGASSPSGRKTKEEPFLPNPSTHSGTAVNVSKDFRPSQDAPWPSTSVSSFPSRREISLPSPSASAHARSLYASPKRRPKPTSAGADIPRVGCPPRRRCTKAGTARPVQPGSTMTRGSAFESRDSVKSVRAPTKKFDIEPMDFPEDGPPPPWPQSNTSRPQSKGSKDEQAKETPHWVTRPHHMLRLGPCATGNGYCLRPAFD